MRTLRLIDLETGLLRRQPLSPRSHMSPLHCKAKHVYESFLSTLPTYPKLRWRKLDSFAYGMG